MSSLSRVLALSLTAISPIWAANQASSPASVNALADRYVSQVREKFPLRYAASGLPNPRRDSLEINRPGELADWRRFLGKLEDDAKSIDAEAIKGKPEWLTLAQLRQAIEQDRAAEVCRSELWAVRTYGWHAILAQVAELQPVDDPEKRAAILARFGQVPAYVDQEIANLGAGVRSGVTAPRMVVERVLGDLDSLLREPLAKSAFGSPAARDEDPSFRKEWATLLEKALTPALMRYRDFLRNEYLPKARASVSITANQDGKACYRAIVAANSSVNVDPDELFARGDSRADHEAQEALLAGKKRYGRSFKDLAALADAMRGDPRNRFESEARLSEFILATIQRGKAGTLKVVPAAPAVDVEARPFPESMGDSAPNGEYIPRDEEGRAPIYYYRTDFENQSPARLESTVLHESWPGHHLQSEITLARRKAGGHPLAQLVYLPGVGEGWATYVEGLARELGLYEGELGLIGSVMDSMTPRLVADLGMHVRGWSERQTQDYLKTRFPATPDERIEMTVLAIANEPGWMVPYALGAMEIESMRAELVRLQKDRFDLRRFHQLIIEDGTVPFPALRSKLGLARGP
jgi:uncharacterized protein (DUF885 family)